VGSAGTVRDLIEAFNRDPLLVLAGPAALYLSAHTTMYENRPLLERLASAMEQPPNLRDDWGFFAGSMGWMRVDALMPLAKAVIKICDSSSPLEPCLPNADGGWPHALERALGLIGKADRVAILGVAPSQTKLSTSPTAPTLQILSHNERKRNIHSHHAGKRLREIHTAKIQHHLCIDTQSRP
jgi:lipopolysaccharide biosynthesis protein